MLTPETQDCTRPALRWLGGKWMLAPWIIAHFPQHRVYVEPYGGAASVLIRKPRSYNEVYNDLDDEVVNLFLVLREPDAAARLVEVLRLTPFARVEFEWAYQPAADPEERARRLVVRCFMGFGSGAANRHVRTGFRGQSIQTGTSPAHDWRTFPESLALVAERFRGVVIEHRPALAVMAAQDSPETLHYVDPPYMPETRSMKARKGGAKYHAYAHEMSAADHADLLEFLHTLHGMVVLSGYPSELYEAAMKGRGWTRYETKALADGARPRREVLWLNAAADDRRELGPLFGVAAQ